MKKNLLRLVVLGGMLITISATVNAQWTRNAATLQTYLTNTGDNLGIGTTNPIYKVDIRSAGIATMQFKSNTENANLLLDKGAANKVASLNYRTAGTTNWQTGCVQTSDYSIRNFNLGTVAMFFDYATNNVGIGTTTPAYKLDVAGDINTGGNKLILSGSANYLQYDAGFGGPRLMGFNGGILGGTAPDVDILKWNWNGATSSVQINGSLGINTVATAVPLTYPSSLGNKISLWGGDAAGHYGLGVQSNTFQLYSDAVGADIALGYGSSGAFTENARFKGNGQVGIGTSTPSTWSKLHVAGGDLALDGTSFYGIRWVDGGTLQADLFRFGSIDNRLYVTNNGTANLTGVYLPTGGINWVSTSDKRLKENIRETAYGLDAILKLSVKEYNYITTKEKRNTIGFIAQEVYKVIPELVAAGDDGAYPGSANAADAAKSGFRPWGVDYAGFTPVLVKAIQEQQSQIAELKTENEELKQTVADMKSCVESLCENSSTSKTGSTEINSSTLFQNSPNPFNQTTVISYQLKGDANNGKIIIRDLSGNLVKQLSIAQSGKGQVTINAKELAQGTYTYTLEINGESVDTKLMVVTK